MLWLLFLVAMTLFPFDFGAAPSVRKRLADAFALHTPPSSGDVAYNLMLFVPAGALLHRIMRRQRRAWRPHRSWLDVVVVCAICCALAAVIELLQIFIPRRDPAITDVMLNTGGALIGGLLASFLGATAEFVLQRMRAVSAVALYVALAVFTIWALWVTGAIQRETRVSNWNPSYPLQVGNEGGGYRPWRGRLYAFEMTNTAAPAASVQSFARGEGLSLPGVAIARFTFDGLAPYRDDTGHVPDLVWTGFPPSGEADGVRLPGTPWLQTKGPAASFSRYISESNSFSLRLVCSTDDPAQVGPARIVSNSIHFGERNLTLGQVGDNLIVRIRTPYTGLNGSKPQVAVAGVFATHERLDILVTYDGASVLTAVAGKGRVHRAPLSPGPILARRLLPLDVRTSEHQTFEYIYITVLSVIAAILVSALRRGWRERLVIGGVWVILFSVLFECILAASSGREYSASSAAATGSIGLAVMMLFAFAGHRPDARSDRDHSLKRLLQS